MEIIPQHAFIFGTFFIVIVMWHATHSTKRRGASATAVKLLDNQAQLKCAKCKQEKKQRQLHL